MVSTRSKVRKKRKCDETESNLQVSSEENSPTLDIHSTVDAVGGTVNADSKSDRTMELNEVTTRQLVATQCLTKSDRKSPDKKGITHSSPKTSASQKSSSRSVSESSGGNELGIVRYTLRSRKVVTPTKELKQDREAYTAAVLSPVEETSYEGSNLTNVEYIASSSAKGHLAVGADEPKFELKTSNQKSVLNLAAKESISTMKVQKSVCNSTTRNQNMDDVAQPVDGPTSSTSPTPVTDTFLTRCASETEVKAYNSPESIASPRLAVTSVSESTIPSSKIEGMNSREEIRPTSSKSSLIEANRCSSAVTMVKDLNTMKLSEARNVSSPTRPGTISSCSKQTSDQSTDLKKPFEPEVQHANALNSGGDNQQEKLNKTLPFSKPIKQVKLHESAIRNAESCELPQSPVNQAKSTESATDCDQTKLKNEISLAETSGIQAAHQKCWPQFESIAGLWKTKDDENFMYDYLCQAYELHSDIARDKVIRDRLPDCLVLLNEEAVWQQIVYRNREEAKHRRYFEELLSVPVGDFMRKSHVVSGINKPKFIDDEEECVNEVEEMKEDGEASDFDGEDREFEQVDLFNLKDENLKDLENELENADEEEDEGERNAEDVKLSEKVMTGKRRKTEVDDRFFKLSEMEEFLDNEEKSGESEGFFDDINDEENGTEANYYYSEFFDPVSDGPMSLERSSADGKRKWPETTRKNEKKVRFEDEESAEESEEREEEEEEKTSDGENSRVNDDRVLFGTIDNNEKKTGFQLRQEKLREKIQAIEKSNLASRNWDLSGEVTAVDREENTMLEKYVDFEQIGRTAVAITPDVTAMIEGLIIQRIKDKAFDDVEKKFRQTEVQKEFRVPAIDEIKKQSLAEVYEEEYQKSRNEGPSSTPSVRQDVEEIGSLIADLFSKLDALSHYQYAPKAVRPEIQIINNMPALQKEEVGPVTSTYEVLLAPEEVKKHISGEMKGKEERDKTDRNRERRKKKKLQHDRRIKNERTNVGNDAENGQVDAGRKTKLKPKKSIQKNKTVAHETIKSSKFFAKLQETMSAEVAGKSMSGREKRKQKTSNPSSKYIL